MKILPLNLRLIVQLFSLISLSLSDSTLFQSYCVYAFRSSTPTEIQGIPNYGSNSIHDTTAASFRQQSINPWEQLSIETAIGSILDQRFATEHQEPPLSQKALNTAFACPETPLPSSMIVHAPTGCESTSRAGIVSNSTGSPLLSWKENCFQLFSPDSQLVDVRTSDVVAKFQTNFNLGSNAVDLLDCNGMTVYTMYESVYNLVGSNYERCGGGKWFQQCEGDVYLRYLIASKTGDTVAMTPYLPLHSQQIYLIDRQSGEILVSMKKNKEWTPADQCPSYQKTWIVDFKELTGITPDSEHGQFVLQDLRWVATSFLSIKGLRDENRGVDGSVTWSACKVESSLLLLIITSCAVVFTALMLWLWARLQWRQHLTRYMFKLQGQLLPKAPNQPS